MTNKFIFSVFFAAAIFCSCKQATTPEKDYLEVETTQVGFSASADSRSVSCASNSLIKVSSSEPAWCTAKVTGGKTIVIQVEKNYGIGVKQARTAIIAVTAGKSEELQIEVKQEAQDAVFNGVNVDEVKFSSVAGQKTLMVEANVSYTAKSSEEWCTATVGYQNLVISVTENFKEDERWATVTIAAEMFDEVETIRVSQKISEETPSKVAVNINGDPKSNMAFNWVTKSTATGKVQIAEGITTDFTSPCYSVNSNSAFPYNGESVHKAVATGLQPGTTYSYRVGFGKGWSDIGKFTTAPEGKQDFSFIYTTDSQGLFEADFQNAGRTLQAATATLPDAKFWIGCGDHVESSSANEWKWYFQYLKKPHLNLPYAPIRGSAAHDCAACIANYFNTAQTTTDGKQGSTYSFMYGDVLFLALNYEISNDVVIMANWMREEVKKYPATRWRIAFLHQAVYTGSNHHGENEAAAAIMDELGIDLVLQGHDHVYEVIGPVKNHNLVSEAVSDRISSSASYSGYKGGTYCVDNGTLYFLNNSCGNKRYTPNNRGATSLVPNYESLFTGCVAQPNLPTFSNISVTQDVITVTTYTVSSSVATEFDKFDVVKNL